MWRWNGPALALMWALAACSGEGTNTVDCAQVCGTFCGTVQGCDCGACDGTQQCMGDNCLCVPDCEGRECGDDGCGGSCGMCPDDGCHDTFCEEGLCVSDCVPLCEGKVCGDDGCGCPCGECAADETCVDGACVPDCLPECGDKECGDDGCGGSCGDCPGAAPVCQDGLCVPDCDPVCEGKECGDDGCGGSCGDCPEHHVCLEEGTCLCQPACDDKECGDDGCGGSCGTCLGPQTECQDGLCVCTPECDGKECGDDGCDGSCGECQAPFQCLEEGQCICVPDCTGKECGGDGCNGLCGTCGCGENCTLAGLCLFTACADKECGSDGCGGSCGSCGEGQYCVFGQCPPDDAACFDDNDVAWDGCTDGELSEFQLHDVTEANQQAVALAQLDGGAYVAVWQSEGEDGNSWGIFARRYPGSGQAGEGVFAVNTETYGSQKAPAVSALAGGGFVVAWESTGQDGFMEGIFAQRLSGDGAPQGTEFQVNTYAQGSQTFPAVLGLAGGTFVVAWQTGGLDGSGTGAVARLFAADGSPAGSEFPLNTELLGDQGGPALAQLGDGFVAAWNSMQQDGNGWGVYAQRFAADGSKTGMEFQVNTATANHQVWPALATLPEGAFLASWQSLAQDGQEYGVYAQRFGALYKQGQEFALHDVTAGSQERVVVVSRAAGGFAAAWQSCPALGVPDSAQDGDGCGIFLRLFDADWQPEGPAQGLPQYTVGDQREPALIELADGSLLVAWESCPATLAPESAQDGHGCGAYARRLTASGAPAFH